MLELKKIRTASDFSQQKLADILKVSRSTVAMWESNKSEPNCDLLIKISKALNVSVDELLGNTDETILESGSQNMYAPKLIAERVKNLAKTRKVLVKDVLEDSGLSKNTLSSMIAGSTPKSENLAKIADYLGCSVDYLLGRTDNPESHIDKLAFLDDRDRELVAAIIEKSYERSRSDVNNISVHEFPYFKAVAHGGDIIVNEPLEKPKIPD